MSGLTLDAGGLIALDRDDRRVIALIARVAESGQRLTIPATALAQAIRNPARQVRLRRLIRQAYVDLVPLNELAATQVGLLLAKSQTADIVDAHIVLCAHASGQPVVTSDPNDLHRLSPNLRLVTV